MYFNCFLRDICFSNLYKGESDWKLRSCCCVALHCIALHLAAMLCFLIVFHDVKERKKYSLVHDKWKKKVQSYDTDWQQSSETKILMRCREEKMEDFSRGIQRRERYGKLIAGLANPREMIAWIYRLASAHSCYCGYCGDKSRIHQASIAGDPV